MQEEILEIVDREGNNHRNCAEVRNPRQSIIIYYCMEPPFEKLNGVIEVVSGYTGGHKENPTYEGGLIRKDWPCGGYSDYL